MLRHSSDSEPGYTRQRRRRYWAYYDGDQRVTDRATIDRLNAIALPPAYRDAWQLSHPGKPHAPTIGVHDKLQWPGPPFACDFIFVTEDLARRVEDVVVNGETDASDHQPVLLELRD